MKTKKYLKIILIILILSSLGSNIVKAQNFDEVNNVKSYLEGFLKSQMEEYNVPGVTLSLVKDGEILISEGYGFSNLKEKRKVDPDRTLFRPGSGSKLFIWTAVMQLVEEGKIDLNVDINNYLDFKIPNEIEGVKGQEVPPITMMNLMNHNAGFEDILEQLFVLNKNSVRPLGEYLKKHIPARIYPPGEQMAYSNYGSALAAYIVQRVSNMDFYDYVQSNIFTPLNMHHSTFRQPPEDSIEGDISHGFVYQKGKYQSDQFEYIQPYPAGSLSSTATDMAKFMIAHLNAGSYNDTNILKPETVDIMHSQSFTHYEDFAGMAHGFIEMKKNNYRVLTHGGDTFLFHSGIFLIPELNLGLFVSYNGRDASLARRSLFDNFMDKYYPVQESVIPKDKTDEFIDSSLLTGIYYPNRNNFSTYQSINRIINQMKIKTDNESDIYYNMSGDTYYFEQLKEGVFYDKKSGNKLYVDSNEGNDIKILYTNSPHNLVKANWYETLTFNIIFLIGYIIFTIIFIIYLIKSLFKKYIKDKYLPEKFTAILYGITAIGFFISLVIVFSDIHPLYNIPYLFLEESSLFENIQKYLWSLPIIAVLLIVMNVRIWFKQRWYLLQKVFYTLYTIWSLGIIWWFYYWNILIF